MSAQEGDGWRQTLPVLAPQQPALWPRAHSGLLGPLGLICRARVQSTNGRTLGVEPKYHPAAVPGPPACHPAGRPPCLHGALVPVRKGGDGSTERQIRRVTDRGGCGGHGVGAVVGRQGPPGGPRALKLSREGRGSSARSQAVFCWDSCPHPSREDPVPKSRLPERSLT